jgi:CTP synthase (UTP-ammonia lyase)
MAIKRIGLIGDFSPDVPAHRAIPKAIALAGQAIGCAVEPIWLATNKILPDDSQQFCGFNGLWCVPASPYASMDGALWAIRFARENRIPFLGTCGGFQHALIEYARNAIGIRDADHAETNPDASNDIVSLLACSLVEQTGQIQLKAKSRIHDACGCDQLTEGYHCRYGLNPAFKSRLEDGNLQFCGWDENGEVRAMELTQHPFFIGTLFQPERTALRGEAHPLITGFVAAI